MVEPLVAVKVILMGELHHLAGKGEWQVDLPQGSTVYSLLQKLAALCGRSLQKPYPTPERKKLDGRQRPV